MSYTESLAEWAHERTVDYTERFKIKTVPIDNGRRYSVIMTDTDREFVVKSTGTTCDAAINEASKHMLQSLWEEDNDEELMVPNVHSMTRTFPQPSHISGYISYL